MLSHSANTKHQSWKGLEHGLKHFGHIEINLLCDHFSVLSWKQLGWLTKVAKEWDELKGFGARNPAHLSYPEMWKTFLANYKDTFPNLSHLITIRHFMPVHLPMPKLGGHLYNGSCQEWLYRNSLGEEILDHLMRISIEGLMCLIPSQWLGTSFRQPGCQMYRMD